MKRDNWIVDHHAIRPAGNSTNCFYCGELLGMQHKIGCVMRSKTVIIEVKLNLIVKVAEDFNKENIEFMYNGEGSYCQNNIIDLINQTKYRLTENDKCMCGLIDVTYIRNATEKDEETFQLFVNQLPS